METKVIIKTMIEEAKETSFFGYSEGENGDWEFVNCQDKKSICKASEQLKISEEAVVAIAQSLDGMVEYLVDLIVGDLKDIWEKINE